ncbi:MAG: cyclic nucleotide-binding domain-containing protein [Acidimicrobiales bacterium]
MTTTHPFARKKRSPGPLQGTPLSDTVPADELRRLDQVGTMVTLKETRSVIQQSGLGRQCLVVIDGTMRVERDGAHVADLGAGDLAGEVGILTGRPCNATVVAESGTSVYAMNRRELATLLAACPALNAQVWRTALDRIPAAR